MDTSRVLLALVVVAACHASQPSQTWLVAAGEKPCEAMARHLVDLMAPAEADWVAVKALRSTIGERCTKDGWTIDAQQCFINAKSIEATDHCAPMLTVDQRNALDTAIGDAFAK
jgi:hypothetical protein